MKILVKLLVALAFFAPGVVSAENAAGDQISAYVAANQKAIVGDLMTIMSLPNVADNPEDIRANA